MAKKRSTPPPPPLTRDEDLAGPLPPTLLAEWRHSSRSVNRAWELMKPALVEGTVLSGDGSHLTARSHQLDPIELAARVDRTQRVCHAIATAAGGRAPGANWTADNFQMIFPPHAPVEFVIGAALEMHRRLSGDPAALPVCIAVHKGVFYELGGGLYGEDANLVEFLAEEAATAGEVLVTKATLEGLRPKTKLATFRRSDLDQVGTEVHRVAPDAKLPAPLAMSRPGGTYPLPYSARFHEGLTGIDHPETWPERRAAMNQTYCVERSVVMAEVTRDMGTRPFDILENGLRDAEMALSIARLLPEGGEIIENLGSFVLATFLDPQAAIEFSHRLGCHFFEANLQIQIGVDRGPVLLVPPDEPEEPWNVLGRPVYIAAKLSHELGEPNRLMFSDRAAAGVKLPGTPVHFEHAVSGVTCVGSSLDILP